VAGPALQAAATPLDLAATAAAALELLSALQGDWIEDDGSLAEIGARELAASLRAAVDAPEGQLTEILRRPLVEVAGAFDLLQAPGFEPSRSTATTC
jgi:hypothetical protein